MLNYSITLNLVLNLLTIKLNWEFPSSKIEKYVETIYELLARTARQVKIIIDPNCYNHRVLLST